jgi:cyclase
MTSGPDMPKIITVGEGFYVRQEVDNMAWIDLGEFAIVVDALERAKLEQEVFEAIHSTLGDKPIHYVLNTHTHRDHTALNKPFQRRCGAEIINQKTSRIPDDGRWFDGSHRRVQMLPMPGCHTDKDIVVWVPDDRALFVGDIFGWGLIPCGSLDAPMAKGLVDTYQRLIAFDAETVIPGHGPLCSTAELERWVEYFSWLCDEVAATGGKKDKQLAKLLPPPDDMRHWWRFLDWKHEDSLNKVASAVRKGRLCAH